MLIHEHAHSEKCTEIMDITKHTHCSYVKDFILEIHKKVLKCLSSLGYSYFLFSFVSSDFIALIGLT